MSMAPWGNFHHRAAAVAVALACALLLTGCPVASAGDSTNGTDQHRLEVMRADPVLRAAKAAPSAYPGWVGGGTLGWHRSVLDATLDAWPRPAQPPGDPAADGLSRLRPILDTLRDSGWVVLWTRCAPPSAPAGTPGSPPNLDDKWAWESVGYRIADGVSYAYRLGGSSYTTGGGRIAIMLIAPNHRDPADLYPDRPDGLASGSTCIERPGAAPATPVEDGRFAMMDQNGNDRPGHVRPSYR
jgi:hypothetical protein